MGAYEHHKLVLCSEMLVGEVLVSVVLVSEVLVSEVTLYINFFTGCPTT